MDGIWSEVFRAIGVLIGAGLIVLAYTIAKNMTKENTKGLFMSLLIGVAVCGAMGLINASKVGDPTCLDSESDDTGTYCNEYADDGFEPTAEQQIREFVFWFVVTLFPIGLGIYSGIRERAEDAGKGSSHE